MIIDPITAYMGEIDLHKMAEVRAVLHPLTMIADKYGVALLGITHLRKSGDGDAVLLVTGSLGFTAASRAVYFVLQDEKNRRRRLFLPAKNNLGIDSGGFAYTIEATTVAAAIETSRLIWEPGAVEGTADDELTQRRRNARKGEDTRTMRRPGCAICSAPARWQRLRSRPRPKPPPSIGAPCSAPPTTSG